MVRVRLQGRVIRVREIHWSVSSLWGNKGIKMYGSLRLHFLNSENVRRYWKYMQLNSKMDEETSNTVIQSDFPGKHIVGTGPHFPAFIL